MIGLIMISFYIVYILANLSCTIIGKWKCMKKAGEKGWKALIPFYNWCVLYKISGLSPYWVGIYIAYFIITILSSVLSEVLANSYMVASDAIAIMLFIMLIMVIIALGYLAIYIVWCVKFCKKYGHGVGFIFGMIFVPVVFFMIIGFDKSKYINDI